MPAGTTSCCSIWEAVASVRLNGLPKTLAPPLLHRSQIVRGSPKSIEGRCLQVRAVAAFGQGLSIGGVFRYDRISLHQFREDFHGEQLLPSREVLLQQLPPALWNAPTSSGDSRCAFQRTSRAPNQLWGGEVIAARRVRPVVWKHLVVVCSTPGLPQCGHQCGHHLIHPPGWFPLPQGKSCWSC